MLEGLMGGGAAAPPAITPDSPIFATEKKGGDDDDDDEKKGGKRGGKRGDRKKDGDRDRDKKDEPTPFEDAEFYQGGPLGPEPQPTGYYPSAAQLPIRQGPQSYPFTGYPTSGVSPQFNLPAPGIGSSLIHHVYPQTPSYTTSPVGTYSPYSPYNQFNQYYQYTTNPTVYQDIKPDDNFTFSDIDMTKYFVDTPGGGGTTSCAFCKSVCRNNPFSYGCHNCRPKCKVTDIRTLQAGGTGWNIGPANVVGSFFTDIYETITQGFHDSEHYDRDREFDCHNKRIKKPTRRRRQWEDRMNQFVDEEDYQFDRHDVPIALQ